MDKQPTHYRMPAWIWKLPRSILNGEDKRFLAFIWWSGFNTCHCHNKYLGRKFGYCRRAIQYRIAKLKQLKFISIGQPNNHLRTIYPRALKDPISWFAAQAKLKRISRPSKTWYEAMAELGRRHK